VPPVRATASPKNSYTSPERVRRRKRINEALGSMEIEHLLGVAFAAQSQAGVAPEWPPQFADGRVFGFALIPPRETVCLDPKLLQLDPGFCDAVTVTPP
jgi:hypothetical protein